MLSVAIIGAGSIGGLRANVISKSEGARVAVVADPDAVRAAQLAKIHTAEAFSDWREALAQPAVDAVVVATPTKYHSEIVVAAFQAGKHVLCEKPLARTAEEASAAVRAWRQTDRVFKVGFNYRYMEHVRKAREILDGNGIGELYFVRSRFGHGGKIGYEKHWCTTVDVGGGGVLIEQGIHIIDLVRCLLGEPIEVSAEAPRYFWPFEGSEDNCFCTMRTASNQFAHLHISWTQWRNIFEFEIFGRDGFLRLEGRDGHYGSQRLVYARRDRAHGRPSEEVFEFNSGRCWELEWQAFVQAICSGVKFSGDGWDGLRAQQIIATAYESSRSHQWVRVPNRRCSDFETGVIR